jgi:hypothetical protein
MTVALASPWNPRGELNRFQRLHPLLQSVYSNMIVTLPPEADAQVVEALQNLPRVTAVVTPDWKQGRYLSLKTALETGADYIHYADFDRLLRWVETRPDEWRQTVQVVVLSDCLVIGRTERGRRTRARCAKQRPCRIVCSRIFWAFRWI